MPRRLKRKAASYSFDFIKEPMCEPTTIALAIAAVGTGASLIQQEENASAQNKFNDKQWENSVKARNENLTQIELQKQQAAQQAGQKQFENNQAAQKAQATTLVSAGENGITGQSVDSLLAELDGSRGRYNDSVSRNLTENINAMDTQRLNVQTSAVNQVSQLKTPQAPDYIGAALKIGSAAYDYSQKKKPE
jgi:uncharacterized protein HemX